MVKFRIGLDALRRKLGHNPMRKQLPSFGVLALSLGAAGTIAMHGPLMTPNEQKPMTRILAAQVTDSVGAVARAIAEEPQGVKWDIANLEHASVDKWIARFTGNMKSSITKYIERMERYDDMIVAKAEAKGVPTDLVYLAMIESGGVASAKSPVGARGLWQFMTPTARDYGLSSSERLDPEKSTDAALEYLSDLHKRFGSWYLAAAAYNTGPGRVARVMKQETGSTKGTDEDFYRIAHRLPRETRDYVPKLVAAARIAKDPARYGIDVRN